MDQQGNTSKYSKFYVQVGKLSGWISALAFALAIVNKLRVSEWLFSPSDLLQAALYLVLFAIFASMAALSSS